VQVEEKRLLTPGTLSRDPTVRGEEEKERQKERKRRERGRRIRGEGKKKDEEKRALCFPKKSMSASTNCPRSAVFLCWVDSQS